MSGYRVRLTPEALEDMKRLQDFLLDRNLSAATRALEAIETAFAFLAASPFSCRKAWPGDHPLLREIVIPFGRSGYVALFEIDSTHQVTILSVRHQREEDYH